MLVFEGEKQVRKLVFFFLGAVFASGKQRKQWLGPGGVASPGFLLSPSVSNNQKMVKGLVFFSRKTTKQKKVKIGYPLKG